MTRPNRVLPTGEFAAIPLRGTLMGNRGILHDGEGRLGKARWRHRHWVACVLSFKDRRRPIMAPRHYTELFFHDEAMALAAGHRPCGECRRADRDRFLGAWEHAHGTRPSVKDLDRALHADRLDGRRQRRPQAALDDLPDGTFVLDGESACLVLGRGLHPLSDAGYGPPRLRRTGGRALVLTPAPVVAALAAGYRPALHPDLAGIFSGGLGVPT